jgi:GAF domain-containing protein
MSDKKTLYSDLRKQIRAVLANVRDPVTAMATVSCMVYETLPYASWVGFYRVVAPSLLRVGPYPGPLGCLEILFDQGVCGAAARTRESQVVADVHAFAGHIACDATARSEIVVPVLDDSGVLVAVLDLDSREPAAFDDDDRRGLEALVADLAQNL